MPILTFANPNNVCAICNKHYTCQIKTNVYTCFPGLIKVDKHNMHRNCGLIAFERNRRIRSGSPTRILSGEATTRTFSVEASVLCA